MVGQAGQTLMEGEPDRLHNIEPKDQQTKCFKAKGHTGFIDTKSVYCMAKEKGTGEKI